jgi:hypothetical protein
MLSGIRVYAGGLWLVMLSFGWLSWLALLDGKLLCLCYFSSLYCLCWISCLIMLSGYAGYIACLCWMDMLAGYAGGHCCLAKLAMLAIPAG